MVSRQPTESVGFVVPVLGVLRKGGCLLRHKRVQHHQRVYEQQQERKSYDAVDVRL